DLDHPTRESPVVVTAPLVLLAIPSVLAGYAVGPVVFGDYFQGALPKAEFEEYHGLGPFIAHGLVSAPFWLALAGILTAWWLYIKRPKLPKRIAIGLGPVYALVERKYGFDELYAWLIDGLMVNGSARLMGWFAGVVRLVQTGLLNQYAVAMLFGVMLLAFWFVVR